jgi:hypothetical protein
VGLPALVVALVAVEGCPVAADPVGLLALVVALVAVEGCPAVLAEECPVVVVAEEEVCLP